jgi:hypothetical protein
MIYRTIICASLLMLVMSCDSRTSPTAAVVAVGSDAIVVRDAMSEYKGIHGREPETFDDLIRNGLSDGSAARLREISERYPDMEFRPDDVTVDSRTIILRLPTGVPGGEWIEVWSDGYVDAISAERRARRDAEQAVEKSEGGATR